MDVLDLDNHRRGFDFRFALTKTKKCLSIIDVSQVLFDVVVVVAVDIDVFLMFLNFV